MKGYLFFFIILMSSSAGNFANASDNSGYTLVWQDLFDASVIDEARNWTIEVNGDGGGNAELQYYRKENISLGIEPVSGEKCLIIKAKKEGFSGKTCTSGRLTTQGKMSFKHGKLEARIKLPHTANGLWPAFWLLGADFSTVGWPKCGEIDIMEMGNANGINNGTQSTYFSGWFHWGESWNNGAYPNWGQALVAPYSLQDDFHLFTLVWDDNYLKMYLDLDKNPSASPYVQMAINGAATVGSAAYYFHKKVFVILNMAIGGNFTQLWDINKITALNAANQYESAMYVDYVKLYQQGVSGEEFVGQKLSANEDIEDNVTISVHPSVTKDVVKVAASAGIAAVDVFDMKGIKQPVAVEETDLHLGHLSSGMYVVIVKDNNGKIKTFKIQKD